MRSVFSKSYFDRNSHSGNYFYVDGCSRFRFYLTSKEVDDAYLCIPKKSTLHLSERDDSSVKIPKSSEKIGLKPEETKMLKMVKKQYECGTHQYLNEIELYNNNEDLLLTTESYYTENSNGDEHKKDVSIGCFKDFFGVVTTYSDKSYVYSSDYKSRVEAISDYFDATAEDEYISETCSKLDVYDYQGNRLATINQPQFDTFDYFKETDFVELNAEVRRQMHESESEM